MHHPGVNQLSHLLRPRSPGNDRCRRSSPSAQPSRPSLALTKPGRLRRNPKPPARPSVSPAPKFLVIPCRWAAVQAGSHLAGVEGELFTSPGSLPFSREGQGASAEPDGAEVGRDGAAGERLVQALLRGGLISTLYQVSQSLHPPNFSSLTL